MNKELLTFERSVTRQGGSLMFAIPPEVLNFLELQEGDMVAILVDSKKKGKFAAFWKKERGE